MLLTKLKALNLICVALLFRKFQKSARLITPHSNLAHFLVKKFSLRDSQTFISSFEIYEPFL